MLPLSKSAAAVARAALNALLPPRCVATGEIVDAPGMIAPRFWAELNFIEAPFCAACGLPFPTDAPAGVMCAVCIDSPPRFDAARAAVVYTEASRKIILGFKYADRLHAVHAFTPWLMRAGAEMISQCDMIVPVPLHPRRLWQRRFNQSALIAQALAKRAGKPHAPDALARLRHTPQQKGLSRKERAKNMRGAFAVVKKDAVRGKTILLIDDVFTSGATLNACARVLKRAGARSVLVLTVARVTREEG